MDSCRGEILRDLSSDGQDQGFGPNADVRFADEDVVFSRGEKNRIRLDGRGDFHFGPDYLLQPLTFSCEWDLEKAKLRKGSYKIPSGTDVAALPPMKATAREACQRAAVSEMKSVARSRRYDYPAIKLRTGVQFDTTSRGGLVTGQSVFQLHPAQEKEAIYTYECVWDQETGRLSDVRTSTEAIGHTEKGVVKCESRDRARRRCEAPIGGFVRVRSNHSDTLCSEGTNWSYDEREIVVWDGCRATFEFDMR